ncbi:MAG TPA: DinB family protein [Terriglobales bacterium]|jgi:uncharacterized damage-inducible protein DinB
MATPQMSLSPEFVLTYRDMMLDGLAREAEITKRVIGAVPDDKADYKPDPNARTGRELASHLANVDVWFLDSIADLKFGMEEDAGKPQLTSAQLVDWYNENIKRGSERVRAMTPEQLMTPVDFIGAFNLPAVLYLGFLNNHCIHHRGQLATYLRPMGSKCPTIYGGSFDEPFEMPEASDTAA